MNDHSEVQVWRSRTPEYRAWQAMLQRCYNPREKSFKYYGARGITVCDEWRHSFDKFISDIGLRPTGLTLDRINNDGGYSPDNCRWATRKQQMLNRRPDKTLGEGNPASKLKRSEVDEIRHQYSTGSDLTSLAHQYGVTYGNVWLIVRGDTWK